MLVFPSRGRSLLLIMPISLTRFLLCVCFCWCCGLPVPAQILASQLRVDTAVKGSNELPRNACGTDILLNHLRRNPVYRQQEQQANERIKQSFILKRKLDGGSGTTADPYLLPVVVHIVSTNPAAISDAVIINAIQDLNDAFSKSGAYAASAGADTKIRFALAKQDPDGGLTTGITRVNSGFSQNLESSMDDARLKNLIQWDPVKYINIWYISNITTELNPAFSCGVWTRGKIGGYATMPFSLNSTSPTEGIVVSGFGSMLAHEMGHYLGLYHTFEGGCTNGDCTLDGDRVCDTPPDGYMGAASNCSSPTNSCTTDTLSGHSNGFFLTDVPDQVSNFMDYGNAPCSNQFTEGQAERMRAAIATQRPGLINNLMNPPCADNIKAYFTRNIADPKTGDLISFTNASVNTTLYEWLLDGVPMSTGTDFAYTFTTAKKYKLTLKAYNNTGCVSMYTDYILVNCGVTARFWSNKQLIASKTGSMVDSILFTNASVNNLGGSASYQWVLTNNALSGRNIVTSNATGGTANDLNYAFPLPGTYGLKLIASAGGCSDSTQTFIIQVLDPTPNATIYVYAADCYQQTKVRLHIQINNSGYQYLPGSKVPVSFYDADPRRAGANKLGTSFIIPDTIPGQCSKVYVDTLDVGRTGLNQLFAVVNDSGNIVTPIILPNTPVVESVYADNFSSISNFRYRVSVNPATATVVVGDSIRLIAQPFPDSYMQDTFTWSPASQLSCSTCYNPWFVADSTRTKQVYATSKYQCYDTASTTIQVRYPDDYSILINSVTCAGADSLLVQVTVNSLPVRGGIPRQLPVAIYKEDPALAGSILLGPVFLVPDSTVSTQSYSFKVKNAGAGNLFAVVNSNSTTSPVAFVTAPFLEKQFANNISAAYVYKPVSKIVDVSICKGSSYYAGGGLRTVSGIYTDTVKTMTGCDSVVITYLTVHALPANFLPADTVLCEANPLPLSLTYPSVTWSDGSSGNTFTITQAGTYGAQVVDRNGCAGADQVTVTYIHCIPIQIPNAFTPNKDGKNDTFKPLVTAPLTHYTMQVYNRWGQLIFETRDYSKGWDGDFQGTPQQNGVYVYQISFNDPDGVATLKKGTLVLLR